MFMKQFVACIWNTYFREREIEIGCNYGKA